MGTSVMLLGWTWLSQGGSSCLSTTEAFLEVEVLYLGMMTFFDAHGYSLGCSCNWGILPQQNLPKEIILNLSSFFFLTVSKKLQIYLRRTHKLAFLGTRAAR